MDFNDIDWNAMWENQSHHSHWNHMTQKELWDKRADSFSKRINRVMDGKEKLDKDDYITKILDHIQVSPDSRVLDIGCGPGTLTIPLAQKSKSVTALDISSEMLKHLKANADHSGISNISYINSSWQDAFEKKLVEPHDVVVASRSLMTGNMQEALKQIVSVTLQSAYLTFPVVHLPFDWEIYRVIGRDGKKHPPYIYILNMLYQMGVEANVEILYSRVKVQFPNIDQAIEDLQWRTDPFSPDEKFKLREYLQRKMSEHPESKLLTHEGFSKWALVWWNKEIL